MGFAVFALLELDIHSDGFEKPALKPGTPNAKNGREVISICHLLGRSDLKTVVRWSNIV